MASWQDPSEVPLSKLDIAYINISQLQEALKDRVKQIKVHLDGIIECDKTNTLGMRQYTYNILQEIDQMMIRLEEIEQKLIEISS